MNKINELDYDSFIITCLRNIKIPNVLYRFKINNPIWILFMLKQLYPISQERCNLNCCITSWEMPMVHSSSPLTGQ